MKKYLQEKQKKKPIAIKHANNKKTSILSNELENTVRSFDN